MHRVGYTYDWVRQDCPDCPGEPFSIQAVDPDTGAQGKLSMRPFADGERIQLDIVVVGFGTVEGVVRDDNGNPIPNARLRLISRHDLATFLTTADQNGAYRFEKVPVGAFGLEIIAVDDDGVQLGSSRLSGEVSSEFTTTNLDPVVFGEGNGVLIGEVRDGAGNAMPHMAVYIAQENTAFGTVGFLDSVETDAAGTFRFEGISPGAYRVRAINVADRLLGDARIAVDEQNTADDPVFVKVVLSGSGTVSGRVMRRDGNTTQPVPHALVAGGRSIVTADADGYFTTTEVPVGLRTLQAKDPESGFLGSAQVNIPVGGHHAQGIEILVEPKGTVIGTVYDINGNPISSQKVVLITSDPTGDAGLGLIAVRTAYTDAQGQYRISFLDFDEYPITAVRGQDAANATARVSILAPETVTDLHMTRPTGRISGRVKDGDGMGVAAKVTLYAVAPNAAGYLEYDPQATMVSDPDDGFSFSNIYHGPFVVKAESFFTPGGPMTSASGVITAVAPVVENIQLMLAHNESYLRGCVLDPEGAPIEPILDGDGVPLPLSVRITSPRLADPLQHDTHNPAPEGIVVDASEGCFESSIALPPDYYTVTVTDQRPGSPYYGLTGRQTMIRIKEGEDTEQDVRLMGLGDLAVEVVDQQGAALPGVTVKVVRGAYPADKRQVILEQSTDMAPLVFTGMVEGSLMVSAMVSTDPDVDVGGRDELRGFGGSATATVVRGGLTTVRVVLAAAGRVNGHFFRPDGTTPVTNAQVTLQAGGRTLYDVTDTAGAFDFVGIPAGSFSLSGHDVATERYGDASGRVEADGQTVQVEIRLGVLGTVDGIVVTADGTAPVPGAEVRLLIHNNARNTMAATADPGGGFYFPRVPGGSFTLKAETDEGLSGSRQGQVEYEAQQVTLNLPLDDSGSIFGVVRDAFGAAVPFADLRLRDGTGRERGIQADGDGAYLINYVPLGHFTLEARPAGAYDEQGRFDTTPGDGGQAMGEITNEGESVNLDIDFQGTMILGVAVDGQQGVSPVSVYLTSSGIFGGRIAASGMDGEVFLFNHVPLAPFSVAARQNTPVGTTISASRAVSIAELPEAGGRLTPDVSLTLNAVTTMTVFVVDDADQPVPGAQVLLSGAGVSQLLAVTDIDGLTEFVGLDFDRDIRATVQSSDGTALGGFVGHIDAEGVVRDGDDNALDSVVIQLDGDPPRVSAVTPADGSVAVPTGTAIEILFSEPMDPTTLVTCPGGNQELHPTIQLLSTSSVVDFNDPYDPCDDSNVVPVSLELTDNNTRAVLTPLSPLDSEVQYRLFISAGEIGEGGALTHVLRDAAGLPLQDHLFSNFVTTDDIAPVIAQVSPARSAVNIMPDSVIRITFSEPLDPAGVNADTFTVTGPSGQVTGQLDMLLGNTVVVFTPSDGSGNKADLLTDATYSVLVAGVRDPAGNLLPTPMEYEFYTLDTIAPTVSQMAAPAGAVATQTFGVTATVDSNDVASVEFFVNGVMQATDHAADTDGLFAANLIMPDHSIEVAARAIDRAGNVGALSDPVPVALTADAPPVLEIISPPVDTVAAIGDVVSFNIVAGDDLGVVSIRGAASGAVTDVHHVQVDPPLSTTTVTINITVPADTPGGPLTLAVTATDIKGQVSAIATRQITVADEVLPTISIDLPGDTVFMPGDSMPVTVTAQDNGAIAGITLSIDEIDFQFEETVTFDTVAQNASHTFNVTVPVNYTDGTILLRATVSDLYGNSVEATQTNPVEIPVELHTTALHGIPADPAVPSANVGQAVHMTRGHADLWGTVAFNGTGDDSQPTVVSVPIHDLSGTVATKYMAIVPSGTNNGLVTWQGNGERSVDAALQIVPAVDKVILAEGDAFAPGSTIVVVGSGFDPADTRLRLPGVGEVAPDEVDAMGRRISVALPPGLQPGFLNVVTSGGESKPYPVGGRFGTIALARQGMAADGGRTSANTGQMVDVLGQGLSEGAALVFRALDENGNAVTAEASLTLINAGGTSAKALVPEDALSGNVQLRLGDGTMIGETDSIQIVPVIESVSNRDPAFGDTITITGKGFDAESTQVAFSYYIESIEETHTISVPAQVSSSSQLTAAVPSYDQQYPVWVSLQVVTRSGQSNPLSIGGQAFSLASAAQTGMPADTMLVSANVGQSITIDVPDSYDRSSQQSCIDTLIFKTRATNGMLEDYEISLNELGPDDAGITVNVPSGAVSGTLALVDCYDEVHDDGSEERMYRQFNIGYLQIVPALNSVSVSEDGVISVSGSGFDVEYTDLLVRPGLFLNTTVTEDGTRLVAVLPGPDIPGWMTAYTGGGYSASLGDGEPPTIAITAPLAGDTVREGVPISINVDVWDDVGISNVTYYANDQLLNTVVAEPYTLAYLPAGCDVSGETRIRVVASNNLGLTAEDEVIVTCIENPEPTLQIVTPAGGDQFIEGAMIDISVQAEDDQGILQVEVFMDGGSTGVAAEPPFEFQTMMPAGSVDDPVFLKAVATDTIGQTAEASIQLVRLANAPPSVTLTSPAEGSQITEGGTITMSAEASDDVGVTGVAFYINDTLIGEDHQAPYVLNRAMPQGDPGSVVLRTVATDTLGQTAEDTVELVRLANTPPSVTLTSPAEGSQITEGATITLSAEASDDAGVAGVAFYIDSVLIGEDHQAPYSINRVMPQGEAGIVTLRAVVTDTLGKSAENTYTLERLANQVPSVAIIAPLDGQEILAGTTFTIGVETQDDVGIERVDFYLDNTPVGTDSTSPYALTAVLTVGVDGESVQLRVVATDTLGVQAEAICQIIRRNDLPPTIVITSPMPGEEIIEGDEITVAAEATDDIGITQVEFFMDGAAIGVDTSAPYAVIAAPTGTGETGRLVRLGAIALDSAANTVTANEVLVQLIPDPLTTVVGRVVDDSGLPVEDATVSCLGIDAITIADGSFEISSIGTLDETIGCIAQTDTASGISDRMAPVRGGITDMGDIILVNLVPNFWIGSESGNWSDPANWSRGVVPESGHRAVIDRPGSYTVTMNGNYAIDQLYMDASDATLLLSGRIVTANVEAIIESGRLIIRNSTINGGGRLINNGSMLVQGNSTLDVPLEQNGTLTIQGTGSWGYARLYTADASTNAGTIRMENTYNDHNDRGSYLNTRGNRFVNEPTGRIEVYATNGDTRNISGYLANEGQIDVIGSINLTINGTYEAAGGVMTGRAYVVDAELLVTGSPDEEGIINIVNDNNTLVGDILPNNTLVIKGTSTWGQSHLTAAQGLTNAGTIRMENTYNDHNDRGAYLTISSGEMINTGRIEVAAANGDGRAIIGSLTNQGQIAVDTGITLNVNGADSVFRQEVGTIIANGSLVRNGGSFVMTGGNIGGSGAVRVNGGRIEIAETVTEPSTVRVVGDGSELVANRSTAVTLWLEGTSSWGFSRLYTLEGAANAGTIRMENTYNDHHDRGSYLNTHGNRFVNEPTGRIEVYATNGDTRNISGYLANEGQIDVIGSINLTINGTYEAAGGVMTGRAYVVDAEVRVTGSPDEEGIINIVHNNNTLVGDILPNNKLVIKGTSTWGQSHLTAAQGFTNAGTIRMENTYNDHHDRGAYLTISSGEMINTGRIEVAAANGDGRAITGSVTNQGQIAVDTGITLNVNGADSVFRQEVGTIIANGSLVRNGGSFVMTGGNIGGSGAVRVNGGRIEIAETVTEPSTVRVVDDGSELVANRSTAVTLWLEGTYSWGFSRLYTLEGSINAGTIRMENTYNDHHDRGSFLNTRGNRFVNEPTGRIEVYATNGDTRNISGYLANEGQIDVIGSINLTITGTYEAAGGVMTGRALCGRCGGAGDRLTGRRGHHQHRTQQQHTGW